MEAAPSAEFEEASAEPADSSSGIARAPRPVVHVGANRETAVGRRRLMWIAPVALAGIAAIVWVALPGENDVPPEESLVLPEPVAASVSIVDADGNTVAGALQLTEGDTVRLGALVATADGTALTDVPVRWATTDASLASIDGSGNLVAIDAGSVGITAAAGDITSDIDLTIAAAAAPPVAAASQPPQTREPPRPQAETARTGETTRSPAPVVEEAPPPQPPPPGTFRMSVEPWANVTLNGETHANWTQNEMTLQPGSYTMRLEHPAMMTVDTTFEIRSGEVTTFAIVLRPRGS
jgi:hypothetical protein